MAEPQTARERGLALCLSCHHLNPCPETGVVHCRRCGASVTMRKRDSLARTWAFLACALITLIPANTYPIMDILLFGNGDPATIIGGIVLLIEHHMYPIAAVVFIASFLVPLLKIAGLMAILITIQRDADHLSPAQCTRLYRLVEFFGRWSMLDVFVVMLLVATVHLGAVARIEAGLGAVAFGSSVVLTMLAAMSFDPRLIWDRHERLD